MRLNYYEIEKVTICPYCVSERDEHGIGCCGESNAHFETAYVYQDEIYRADEIEIFKPLIDTIQYETRRLFTKRYWNLKKRQLRDNLCKAYDGSFWYKGKNYKTPIIKLRQLLGFQWTKLDCIILKQLHDFPLYYTPPHIAEQQRQKAKAYQIEMNKKYQK
jgi:hypothetical protein